MKSSVIYTNKQGHQIKFDLSIIQYDELKKQYNKGIYYNVQRELFSFHCNKLKFLNEDTTFTVSANIVVNEIKKSYKLSDWNIRQEKSHANNIDIIIITSNINKTYDSFVIDMKKYGYYLAYHSLIQRDNMEFNFLYFEPVYTNDICNLVRYNQLAIHLTTEENMKLIVQDHMIKPKTGERQMTYPPRIHLITGLIPNKIENELLDSLYKESKIKSQYYCRCVINTTQLPVNMKFYKDPNFEYGVYTYDNIPFKYVDYIYKINIDTKESTQIWPILTKNEIQEKLEKHKQLNDMLLEYYKNYCDNK